MGNHVDRGGHGSREAASAPGRLHRRPGRPRARRGAHPEAPRWARLQPGSGNHGAPWNGPGRRRAPWRRGSPHPAPRRRPPRSLRSLPRAASLRAAALRPPAPRPSAPSDTPSIPATGRSSASAPAPRSCSPAALGRSIAGPPGVESRRAARVGPAWRRRRGPFHRASSPPSSSSSSPAAARVLPERHGVAAFRAGTKGRAAQWGATSPWAPAPPPARAEAASRSQAVPARGPALTWDESCYFAERGPRRVRAPRAGGGRAGRSGGRARRAWPGQPRRLAGGGGRAGAVYFPLSLCVSVRCALA